MIEKIKKEIQRQLQESEERLSHINARGFVAPNEEQLIVHLKGLLSFIDTLEVKEVDLEKEYKDFVEGDPVYNKLVNGIVGKAIAKHFFELGLQARTDKELVEKVYDWLKNYAFFDDEQKVHLPTLLHDFIKDSRTF